MSTETQMKAVVWKGPFEVAIESVPRPKIVNPNDIVVKVTTTAICGSDLQYVFLPESLSTFLLTK